ncbi:MAG: tyrosine--tRNA ligase [Verrucomicrobiae bacterium]|nr:tyrosine--tRNA ligase [Verrucomicrobiae bacterium]
MKSVSEQIDLLLRGAAQVISNEDLKKKLSKNIPLRIKLGVDPTAPDLHLGHTVALAKLRQFQDLGHTAVLIIGDFTSMIGDPTGRSTTRPPLSREAILANAKTYQDQAFKVLSHDRLEVVFNGEWFGKMSFAEVIRLSSRVSISQMMQRRDFKERLQAGTDIRHHETVYPIMQGWDSVMVRADVELGGTDQLFNILVGRDLQKDEGQEQQVAMLLPILEGLDGTQKMSKSLGNYIGVTETPSDIFGKAMSISDDLMWRWYILLFGKSEQEISQLKNGHPMEAKKSLAQALVERFHDSEKARQARTDFEQKFSKRDVSSADLPALTAAASITALDLVMSTGKIASRGEARRLIQQGGVELAGQKLADPQASLTPKTGDVLKIGKKLFYRIA